MEQTGGDDDVICSAYLIQSGVNHPLYFNTNGSQDDWFVARMDKILNKESSGQWNKTH